MADGMSWRGFCLLLADSRNCSETTERTELTCSSGPLGERKWWQVGQEVRGLMQTRQNVWPHGSVVGALKSRLQRAQWSCSSRRMDTAIVVSWNCC